MLRVRCLNAGAAALSGVHHGAAEALRVWILKGGYVATFLIVLGLPLDYSMHNYHLEVPLLIDS